VGDGAASTARWKPEITFTNVGKINFELLMKEHQGVEALGDVMNYEGCSRASSLR
jgi:hypothetical protein